MKMTLEDLQRLRAELPSRETSVDATEEEIKQLQSPCQCPPRGNVHQYDCPKMKLSLRMLWERGTEQDRETFVRAFRFTLPYMSDEEAHQFNQLCQEIGAKM
jgi:hypothetical protein